ncbi:beta strand repeat-containing protein [Hymenobacter negativus]|uniref:Right-handed parallel beta-helix repeat-containing protein n=1 Tax=Hymenobacter negativus TaxID=2795026 RepID=A0ABS3QMC3_9BACT|nr:right-handed parallel beta-helix repeat-containing protein [Hymenobacter negativus]MBO2012246.1 right-handed parallel beta-helix repeat-containing protein [Hymenobacter negativus]
MNSILQFLKPALRRASYASGWGAALLGFLLTCGPASWAQQGKNGPGTITAASTVVNTYTSLSADATTGASTITVANSALTGGAFGATPLAPGDFVMLIQMQGATIDTGTGASTYGAITAYNNAGRYELLEVKAVPSATSITFQCALTNSYTAAGQVQIVRIPRYTALTLNANTSIVAPAWNGSTGGIVALDVQGDVIFNNSAKIDVSGLGFRGGAVTNASTYPSGGTAYATTSNTLGAEKGEGIAGSQTTYDGLTGRYGRGAAANGGGGGNTHNAAGGGGSNVGTGTWTGNGNPAAGYTTSWNQEAANFATTTSPGGGRGGYSYSINNADATTQGPGNTAWGADNRLNLGGLGGRPLNVTNRLFFGGGGGAGDANNGGGTAGGNGGGLIYILTGGKIGGGPNASLLASGAAAANNTNGTDAPGGGGGGGTIVLNAAVNIESVTVSVAGGRGGNHGVGTSNAEAEGPGGGGGGGYLAYTAFNAGGPPTVNTTGGANGTTTSTSLTEFPPNGATIGGAGLTATFTYNTQCRIVADVVTTLATAQTTALMGTNVTYTATVRNSSATVAATDVAPTVQLPAGLLNVVVKDKTGVTLTNSTTTGYNQLTGLVTFPTETSLAASTTLTYSITFPAPNYTATITGQAQSTASSNDFVPTNNNGSAAAANVQTVVSLPNNSCTGTAYSTAGSGLYAEYYAGYFNDDLGYFAANTPGVTRTDAFLNYFAADSWGNIVPPGTGTVSNPNTYSSRYRGSIKINTAGSYTFRLTSDDASYLWVDGAALAATPVLASAVINNGSQHALTSVTGTVRLSAGSHNLLVFFGENQGDNSLILEYSGPDTGNNNINIPNAVLCPTLANVPPVAVAVTNTPAISNTGGAATLAPLAGTDQDGTVTNYYITTIPTAAQGVLSLGGTPVTAGQTITAAQAATLQFTPSTTFTGNATFTFQAQDNSGQLSNDIATYTIPVVFGINGIVFEDINYGGGAGRTIATANGVTAGSAVGVGTAGNAATAATVELYDGAGNFVATTKTSTTAGSLGQYNFTVATAGNYTVRVVNSTVRSTRPGSVAGLLPVQTYNGSTDRVGGEDPARGDAAANTGTQTLGALAVATAGATIGTIAESQQAITLSGTSGSTGRDFGYNFDVVTNTNDAGQGSLRQFLTNANTLTNAGLAQVGQTAGKEVSIFMIPDGAADAGIRAGVASGLTAGVAVITPLTVLPTILDSGTSIDGTTQTTNIGNNNAGVLGVGGNVGTGANGVDETSGATDDLALSQTNRPEVQIQDGAANLAIGLNVQANATTLRGLSVVGFGNNANADSDANILVSNVTGFVIEANFLGLSATKANFATGTTATGTGDNIRLINGDGNGTLTGATASIIQNNLIGYANGKGIGVENGSTGVVIRNNEIRNNGIDNNNLDGIDIENSSNTIVTGNLVVDNAGVGVDGFGSTGSNTITGNTITGNGRANGETAGVRVYGAGTTVSQNIIRDNYGAGIQVQSGASNNTFSLNSISGNGTVTTTTGGAASGQIGIDLLSATDSDTKGNAPYVTKNDNGDGDTGGNGLINFPIIQTATLSSTTLKLTGFAKPGAIIEFYIASADASGFGEGSLYLSTQTEGVSDADANTGSYSGLINGLDQGAETGQNRYSFTIPLSSFSALQLAALQSGAVLTSTATLSGQGTSEFSGNISLSADVTTTITGPSNIAAGQVTGTFTATFSNVGSVSASAVAQTVTLPAGASLTGAQLTTIQTAYPGTNLSGSTLTFPATAQLAAGASNVYQFVFTAPNTAGANSIGSSVTTTTTQSPNTAADASTFPINVTSVADVVATIVGSAGTSVSAGTTGTFTATFSNSGPSAAAGTVPTVQLSPNVTNVTIGGAGPTTTVGSVATYAGGVTYNTSTGVLMAPAATLNNGASVVYTIGYTQPMQGNVTATATITTTTSQGALSANGNPSTANDVQTATNTGSAGFDLVTTLAGPTTAVAGTQVTYAVTTSNGGPGAAPNAVQTVSMVTSAALTNVFLTNGGTYSYSGGTSLFTFPTIPSLGNGQQVNNSISFTSPGPTASSLSLTALITPNTSAAGDANTPNNQFSISTNLTAAPAATGNTANLNVSISSNAPTGGVAAGASVVFTVKQGNNGPNSATNVVTQVYLPTGLSGVVVKDKSGATVAGAYNSATGVVTFPTETNQASGITPLSYTITANAPASGVVTATATVTAGTNDPVPADNVALTTVTVNQPIAGDVLTTLNGPATATPGESIVYTVAAINSGTTAATAVTQTVQFPAGLAGVVVRDGSGNIITNSTTTGYNSVTGLVTFAPAATLAAGASLTRTITLPAPSNSGSATGGSIVPVASISTTSADNVLTNNSASITTVIKPTTDFMVSLTGPATAVVGNPVTYTVTVTNNGASIGDQQATLQLPTGLDVAAAGLVLPTGASYNTTTGVLTLAAVTAQGLGSASAVTNTVSFNMPAGIAVLAPTVQVAPAANTNDANLSNNAATATTTVTPATETVIDLATTVFSNVTTQNSGTAIVFTVTSTNNTTGSSATNTIQQLSLAAGLIGVQVNGASASSTTNGVSNYAGGVTYDANTGIVAFPAVTLVNGAPISRTVQVDAPSAGPLVATASIKSSQTDNVSANNSNSASVAITSRTDVVTSTTGPATTSPSTPVSYSVITTNNGPAVALGVVPAITLPSGATNVVLPAGASLSGSIVTFATTGNLGIGQSVTNTVTFTSPAATGTYNVAGTATTTTTETTTANNGSTVATTNTAPTAAPVAFDVVNKTTYNATNGTVNTPSANTAGQFLLSGLSAAASSGQSLNNYTITAIPTATQGTLYYNTTGTTYVAVGVNQVLTPAQAASLKFDPADNATTTNSVGDITFSYTVTDNLGKTSNTALFTIPVGRDNTSVYTATPNKGGTVQYQTNDVLAFVIDPNGAAYNGSGLVYNPSGTTTTILAAGGNNGLVNQPNSVVQAPSGSGPAASGLYPANPTNVLPAGVSLDPTTGLIYVSNRALLVNNNSVRYYQINVTTTDIYGGTNAVTAQFSIGAYPLPVELTVFTAKAVNNADAALTWTTASEKSNDHFDVERSLNAADYVKIGEVKGQGSKASATDYALTDVGIGAKASGVVYYRLKQVDIDGTATYSPVRSVSFTKALAPAIALFPNPATAVTQLDLSQLPTGSYQLSVLDATGRVVLSAKLEAGLAHALELNTIASGTYTVRVQGAGISLTKRLIKE